MFRRSGRRFADKNMRQTKKARAHSDSTGTECALETLRGRFVTRMVAAACAAGRGLADAAGPRRAGVDVAQSTDEND
jgi:hypothetical protein